MESTPDTGLHRMVLEYMEKGFLENIVDMFRHDSSLYAVLPLMIRDGRSRVRIGAVSLVECLREEHAQHILRMLGDIADGLGDDNPTVRGDVLYLLGETRLSEAIPHVERALKDESHAVRLMAEETLSELRALHG